MPPLKSRAELFAQVRKLDREAKEATEYRRGLEAMRDKMREKYPWLPAPDTQEGNP